MYDIHSVYWCSIIGEWYDCLWIISDDYLIRWFEWTLVITNSTISILILLSLFSNRKLLIDIGWNLLIDRFIECEYILIDIVFSAVIITDGVVYTCQSVTIYTSIHSWYVVD